MTSCEQQAFSLYRLQVPRYPSGLGLALCFPPGKQRSSMPIAPAHNTTKAQAMPIIQAGLPKPLLMATCNEPAKGVWQRDGAARVIFFPCLSLLPNEPGSVLKGALAAAYHHAPPRRNRAEPPQTSSSLTPARRRQAMLVGRHKLSQSV